MFWARIAAPNFSMGCEIALENLYAFAYAQNWQIQFFQ